MVDGDYEGDIVSLFIAENRYDKEAQVLRFGVKVEGETVYSDVSLRDRVIPVGINAGKRECDVAKELVADLGADSTVDWSDVDGQTWWKGKRAHIRAKSKLRPAHTFNGVDYPDTVETTYYISAPRARRAVYKGDLNALLGGTAKQKPARQAPDGDVLRAAREIFVDPAPEDVPF